jgi:adenylate cyclase, class 2
VNYSFALSGREIAATLVTVPELDGTFIEVETLTSETADLPAALTAVRGALDDLGITAEDRTTELYTDAVLRRRQGGER